jgi:hypothetical protein
MDNSQSGISDSLLVCIVISQAFEAFDFTDLCSKLTCAVYHGRGAVADVIDNEHTTLPEVVLIPWRPFRIFIRETPQDPIFVA